MYISYIYTWKHTYIHIHVYMYISQAPVPHPGGVPVQRVVVVVAGERGPVRREAGVGGRRVVQRDHRHFDEQCPGVGVFAPPRAAPRDGEPLIAQQALVDDAHGRDADQLRAGRDVRSRGDEAAVRAVLEAEGDRAAPRFLQPLRYKRLRRGGIVRQQPGNALRRGTRVHQAVKSTLEWGRDILHQSPWTTLLGPPARENNATFAPNLYKT